jgi:ribosomal protein S27AE
MPDADKLTCAGCGAEMNHHADKLDYGVVPGEASDSADEAGVLIEAHTCPDCGHTATRAAAP